MHKIERKSFDKAPKLDFNDCKQFHGKMVYFDN